MPEMSIDVALELAVVSIRECMEWEEMNEQHFAEECSGEQPVAITLANEVIEVLEQLRYDFVVGNAMVMKQEECDGI